MRIWVENRVDFSLPKNQLTAGIALIMGIANFTIVLGDVEFTGIVLGTVAAIVVYHLMNGLGKLRGTDAEPADAGADGGASDADAGERTAAGDARGA